MRNPAVGSAAGLGQAKGGTGGCIVCVRVRVLRRSPQRRMKNAPKNGNPQSEGRVALDGKSRGIAGDRTGLLETAALLMLMFFVALSLLISSCPVASPSSLEAGGLSAYIRVVSIHALYGEKVDGT